MTALICWHTNAALILDKDVHFNFFSIFSLTLPPYWVTFSRTADLRRLLIGTFSIFWRQNCCMTMTMTLTMTLTLTLTMTLTIRVGFSHYLEQFEGKCVTDVLVYFCSAGFFSGLKFWIWKFGIPKGSENKFQKSLGLVFLQIWCYLHKMTHFRHKQANLTKMLTQQKIKRQKFCLHFFFTLQHQFLLFWMSFDWQKCLILTSGFPLLATTHYLCFTPFYYVFSINVWPWCKKTRHTNNF